MNLLDKFLLDLENKTLKLVFVGMSNTGKSYRSRVLRNELGFEWFHIDGEIMNELGFSDMSEISDWLSYPDSPGFAEREEKYLEFEDKFTKRINKMDASGNVVCDTTGSVVHLPDETLKTLKTSAIVVNLDIDEADTDKMIEKFFRNPKPVVWGEFFDKKPEEDPETALRRCYPNLLKERTKKYRTLAHISAPAKELKDKNANETLEIIGKYLNYVS